MNYVAENLSMLDFFVSWRWARPLDRKGAFWYCRSHPGEVLGKGRDQELLTIIAQRRPDGGKLRALARGAFRVWDELGALVIGPAGRALRYAWSAVALLTAFLLIGSSGCTREPERQWYKIGQPYSLAEFQRDRTECTREKRLDFDCMRARGWRDVSPDRPAPSPEPAKVRPRGY